MLNKFCLPLLVLLTLSGCASLTDAPRNVVGYSTRALEAARAKSLYQTYQARFTEVYAAVQEFSAAAKYTVFMKDEIHGLVVVMDVPGMVNTTQVAVYVVPQAQGESVKVEVASRSTPAKRVVAAELFSRLNRKFGKV